MIYDCFLFNNELEILDIRLHELDSVVDKFVIVESTVTHSIKPKPLYFKNNRKKFEKFNHKIIHIIIDDTPDVTLPWIVNDYQFCQISRGLKNCLPEDIILFGDADEIPRAETVRKWIKKPGKLKVFEQYLCQYYLNYIDSITYPWFGTRMTLYKYLLTYETIWIAKFSKPNITIANGGWHFTYMGGIERIQKKMASMTHQEYNNDNYNTPEKITKAIYEGKDFIHNKSHFKLVDNNLLPQYVQDNVNKFEYMLQKKQKKNTYTYRLVNFLLVYKEKIRIIIRVLRRKASKILPK